MGGQVRILIATRFGVGVRDSEWFEHRLHLLRAITVPSLAAQTSKSFVWVIFTDREMPGAARDALDAAVAKLGALAVILAGVSYDRASLSRCLDEFCDQSLMRVSCRLDDDDALHPETVERIIVAAREFASRQGGKPNLALTFPRGLEWVMYDMVDVSKRAGGRDHVERAMLYEFVRPFIGTSCIMISRPGSTRTFFDISHSEAGLEEGVVDCEVSVRDTQEFMWLYSRHKQADSGIVKARTRKVVSMTNDDLCRYFRLDGDGIAAYRAVAQRYSYVVEKKSMKARMALQREKLRLQDDVSSSVEQIAQVEAELARLSGEFMGDRELAPIGKEISKDGVAFNSVRDAGVDEAVRVVIYDYLALDYRLIQVIPRGETVTVPWGFFEHRDYKWKVQTMVEGRWKDLTRYAPFAFPEQVVKAPDGAE